MNQQPRATPRSAALHTRALRKIPGGVHSNVRLNAPSLFFSRASGAMLWDVDGNDYVDYVLGQGPHFLGHAQPEVNSAVAKACESGMLYGGQHALEVEACELILDALGWADMVRLGMTGTECVQASLRAARAATGRSKFVRFEGHYHGWLDNVLSTTIDGRVEAASAGQLPRHLEDSYVLPWNNPIALEELLTSSSTSIAAVIMEPLMANSGCIEPSEGYLQMVRNLCTKHGVVLVFDEVITGFRVARGGAVERYGVVPDLAVYGKAMAGGWPVAALAGRAEFMEPFGRGTVNHSGTFNASVMASAAVIATQRILALDPPYEGVERLGTELMESVVKIGVRHNIPLRVQGVPMAFHVSFGPSDPVRDFEGYRGLDLQRYARFAYNLASYGLWVTMRGVWYVSSAHGDAELQLTISRLEAALSADLP